MNQATWFATTPMRKGRYRHGAGVVDNKIYVMSPGEDSTDRLVQIYDIASDEWSQITAPFTPQWKSSCCMVGDKLYLTGGASRTTTGRYNSTYIYDMKTNTYTSGARMPGQVADAVTVAVGHKLYSLGGSGHTSAGNVGVSVFYIYDTVTGEWTDAGRGPRITSGASPAAAVGSKFYVFQSNKVTDIYDTETGIWSTRAIMPAVGGRSKAITIGSRIYCIGGTSNTSGTVYIYDTITDTWSEAEGSKMPLPKNSFSAVLHNNHIYCSGGIGTGPSTVQQVYCLEGCHMQQYVVRETYSSSDNKVKLAETATFVPEYGRYRKAAPAVEGYYIAGHNLDGEKVESRIAEIPSVGQNHLVEFLFEPGEPEPPEEGPYVIREGYLNQNGTAIQDDTYAIVDEGERYEAVAPRLEGYKRVGHQVDDNEPLETRTVLIEEVQGDHTVLFLYEPCNGEKCVDPDEDEYVIYEQYLEQDGTQVLPDSHSYVKEGENYRKTAPWVEGYNRIGHQVDEGEMDSRRTAEIRVVMESHQVRFYYEPCDGDNCTDHSDDGGGNGNGDGGGNGNGDGGGNGNGDGGGNGNGDGGGNGNGDGGGNGNGDGGGNGNGDGGGNGNGDGGGNGNGDGGGNGNGDGGGNGNGDGGGNGNGDGGGNGNGDGGGNGNGDGGGNANGDGGGNGNGDGGGNGNGDGGGNGNGDGGGNGNGDGGGNGNGDGGGNGNGSGSDNQGGNHMKKGVQQLLLQRGCQDCGYANSTLQ